MFIIRPYLNHLHQSLFVLLGEAHLNIAQIDLRPRNHDPNQSLIVGPQPVHALEQPGGQVVGPVPNDGHQSQQCVFGSTGEFVFDGLFERVAGEFLVLVEDESQLAAISLAHDLVESGFVRAVEQLSGSQQGLGVFEGAFLVNFFGFVSVTL